MRNVLVYMNILTGTSMEFVQVVYYSITVATNVA